jgi:alpha-tubulin suppressor-like RCC1 family protein
MQASSALQKKIVLTTLSIAENINVCFNRMSTCTQLLFIPQAKAYTRRVYLTYVLQLLSSELTMLVCAKVMMTFFYNQNTLLMLTVGSFVPFLAVVYRVWRYLPCPQITEYISNIALVVCFIGLFVVMSSDSGEEGATDETSELSKMIALFVRLMMYWPWLVLASLISRLHVERIGARNPFSPLTDLPLLGFTSAFAHVMMLSAIKHISITDCCALCFLDPIVCAVVAPIALGKARVHFHSKYLKVYTCLTFCVYCYLYDPTLSFKGEIDPVLMWNHIYFLLGRLALAIRGFYAKRAYCKFHHSAAPPRPPESEALFHNEFPPQKHRFQKFPEPTLLTLDAIFDSGLRDMDFHGMGPLGTLDLHNLTEMAYLLPLAAIATGMLEPTFTKGLLDPLDTYKTSMLARDIAIEASITDKKLAMRDVLEIPANSDYIKAIIWVIIFCISRISSPSACSKVLFDKGSSMHSWKYQPIILLLVFFFIDILWINVELSVDRIVWIVVGAAIYAYWRDQVYSYMRRKQYLYATQELHYYQPQCLRTLQRRTLLEFLEQTASEDFGFMLLQTGIRNGQNIRELSRDVDLKVWDPSPASTAAWKLAVSLVNKSMRISRHKHKSKDAIRAEVEEQMYKLVINMADAAVESCIPNQQLRRPCSLQEMQQRKIAFKRLQALSHRRKMLRHDRRVGKTTGQVAIANGGEPFSSKAVKALAAPPLPATGLVTAADGRTVAAQQMGLTAASSVGFSINPAPRRAGTDAAAPPTAPTQSMPGHADSEGESSDHSDENAGAARKATKQNAGLSLPRGVWAFADQCGLNHLPPVGGTIVIAFGDGMRGQLCLEPDVAAKRNNGAANTIEQLKGTNPVQIEASGVGSFVVVKKGFVWGFGSNRMTELGLRKDVTQTGTAQMVKYLREEEIVQVAGSKAASGQAHTLALTKSGEVYSFGSSAHGALGQGPEYRQCSPMIVKMSRETPIRFVVSGAQHSLFVSDTGRLYTVGDNGYGQLGLGQAQKGKDAGKKIVFTCEPEPLDEWHLEAGFVRIAAAGNNHNLAVTDRGQLWSWGANANGQLGLGDSIHKYTPQLIKPLKGIDIAAVACGSLHSLAVGREGAHVYSWGSNVQGQLGIGQQSAAEGQQRNLPTLCQALSNKVGSQIIQVAAAACHSLALTRIGEVYSFGDNSCGQLGFYPQAPETRSKAAVAASSHFSASRFAREQDHPRVHASGVVRLWEPERIVSLAEYRIRMVSTAEMHSLVLAA